MVSLFGRTVFAKEMTFDPSTTLVISDSVYGIRYTMYMYNVGLLIHGNGTNSVSKASLVSFFASCEGTWQAMNSTLTAMLSVDHTSIIVHTDTPTTYESRGLIARLTYWGWS
jgi:hypothetical protein